MALLARGTAGLEDTRQILAKSGAHALAVPVDVANPESINRAKDIVAPYLTCRAFVGGMIGVGWGRIVNVTSADALDVNGRFLWIKDGLQEPIPSWVQPVETQPWRR